MAKNKKFMNRKLETFLNSLSAILIAFLAGGFVVWLSGQDPVMVFSAIIQGSVGSIYGIKNTITYTMPIILLWFSYSICAKSGFFNIGQEAQMYASALAIVLLQYIFPNLPNLVLLLVMIGGAILAGGIVDLIPGLFKITLGINEIIVALLMNFIFALLTEYLLVYSPLGSGGTSKVMSIIVSPEISLEVLAIIVVIIIFAYYFLMKNSVFGFRVKMVGSNPFNAKLSGINTSKIILISTFLGGMFSALTSIYFIFGIYHRIHLGFVGSLGFYGMAAALIGNLSVIGVVLGSLIFGMLESGSVYLTVTTNIGNEFIEVVQGLIVLFATIEILQYIVRTKVKGGTE